MRPLFDLFDSNFFASPKRRPRVASTRQVRALRAGHLPCSERLARAERVAGPARRVAHVAGGASRGGAGGGWRQTRWLRRLDLLVVFSPW